MMTRLLLPQTPAHDVPSTRLPELDRTMVHQYKDPMVPERAQFCIRIHNSKEGSGLENSCHFLETSRR